MKLQLSFLEKQNRVTKFAGLPAEPATNAEVTQVTLEKTKGLPAGPATNAEVTQVTQVTIENEVTVKFLHADTPEEMSDFQPSGATQNTPAMPEHASTEQNALQATPAQRPENDAERLAAWERGEWVTIPHTAESLEIYRALELEHMARQIGKPEVVEELSRALATIDQIDQQQRPDDFAFALSVLRSATEDAACHLSREQKRAAA